MEKDLQQQYLDTESNRRLFLIRSLNCAENSIFNIASQQHKKKPPHKAVNINSFCCRNCDVTDIPVDRRCIYLLVMKEYESVEIR